MDTAAPPSRLDEPAARALLRDAWGLEPVRLRALGSNEDQNLMLELANGERLLLKVTHPGVPREALEAQGAAARWMHGQGLPLAVPLARPSLTGGAIAAVGADGRHARVLDFLPGEPPRGAVAPSGLPGALGHAAASVVMALEDFDHPGLDRSGDWDLREAARVVEEATPLLDPARAAELHALVAAAERRLARVRAALPVQAIHGDLTADNVVLDADGAIAGVIDLGDLGRGWAVAELAVAVSGLLHLDGPAIAHALDAIASFDQVRPLAEVEIVALWPLVVLRAAVLAAAGERVLAGDPGNAYARVRRPLEERILERAIALGLEEAELLIRDALGRLPRSGGTLAPMVAAAGASVVDLSVLGDTADAGAWLDPNHGERALRDAAGEHGAATRYGEHRLLPAAGSAAMPRSFALAVELALPAGMPVSAPAPATVTVAPDGRVVLTLEGGGAVFVGGISLETVPGAMVAAGACLGRATAGTMLSVQRCAVSGVLPPALVATGLEDRWRRICPDPAVLLDRGPAPASSRDPGAMLAARHAAFAPVQEHYYGSPPRIERGWRHLLIDTAGRGYLDMVNNVAILGHGEPRIADAVARQLRRLNTNSRFHYEAVVTFSEALAARAPEGLDTVLLCNSGSEAVDLAIRLVRAATGRTDILALTEAYHGWTVGADAISTSLGDNPRALATRPPWVHLLDAPNTYRGRHRGPDAHRYLDDALARMAELDQTGAELAGFVSEPIFGNGGGILLPEGYLAGVWGAVRERGGLVVSDEVQVSYGRLGEHFWGFEQQGVVPDVIAVAKAMGNGHPLGAVITTRAIAESFAGEGSFFSSAGGSPVSCVVGSTVLAVLDQDGLQENARTTGAMLAGGLRSLAERHPCLGAVHGMGLYLGVEVVAGNPDAPDARAAGEICEALLDEGVIVQPTGDHKNVLKIKPPLTIDAEAVARFLGALERVMVLRASRAAL